MEERERIRRETAAFAAILSEEDHSSVVDFEKKKDGVLRIRRHVDAGPFCVILCSRVSFFGCYFCFYFFFLKGGLEDAQARGTQETRQRELR